MLLLQDFWLREAGRLPTVNQLVRWLRKGGVEIVDSETQDDNVKHTGLAFVRLDALSALEAAQRELKRD